MLGCLQMGCLPSRSTSVKPTNSMNSPDVLDHHRTSGGQNNNYYNNNGKTPNDNRREIIEDGGGGEVKGEDYDKLMKELVDVGDGLIRGDNMTHVGDESLTRSSSNLKKNQGEQEAEQRNNMMTMMMNVNDDDDHQAMTDQLQSIERKQKNRRDTKRAMGDTFDDEMIEQSPDVTSDGLEREMENGVDSNVVDGADKLGGDGEKSSQDESQRDGKANSDSQANSSIDDELNSELLKQYIAVDYEIAQLEDKDALRIYHEKIEQLEQLERELDMISSEAEEVATRSEIDMEQQYRSQDGDITNPLHRADSRGELESNSAISNLTESASPKSSIINQRKQQQHLAKGSKNKILIIDGGKTTTTTTAAKIGASSIKQTNGLSIQEDGNNVYSVAQVANNETSASSATYSTCQEVFNRKIILERERDKLKKEVELVIMECDRLQQKYKKRDDILDKLFDGRTGNGLENHLEQQLNWLMEQKHYVDQVFYAWKRAETLTSQTCEQFANALELLKRLPKLEDENSIKEISKSISELLVKSRQDMEQAQRYNPNVDAPFFTDTETERFDKIIEIISQSKPISQSEYSQIATVIQFAYKRAVSIRLWLEQILQITIARDSFELAEEHKWIAIQLRKERITLINSKLQEPPYRSMALAIKEQITQQMRQQQQQQLQKQQQQQQEQQQNDVNNNNSSRVQTANTTNGAKKSEINRDSGVECDEIDIEEEIYRVLEMNKSRLEAAIAMQRDNSAGFNSRLITTNNDNMSSINQQQRDQLMRDRVQKRVESGQQVGMFNGNDVVGKQKLANGSGDFERKMIEQQSSLDRSTSQSAASSVPSKLRVELDEAARRNLLKQIDQIHAEHKSRLDNFRGCTKAKTSDFRLNKRQQIENRTRSISGGERR